MENIDEWTRMELRGRLPECLDEERGFFESALLVCEETAAIERCSFYETAVRLRANLLELHDLDLRSYRRVQADMDDRSLWSVTGVDTPLTAVLWHFDVALSMVEMHCSDEIALSFSPEIQQARAEDWDRFYIDEMLMETGLDGPVSTEA